MGVKLKSKKIIYLNLLFLILFSTFSFLNSSKFGIFKDENESSISLINSGYWNLTGESIFIDGSASGVGAHNWTWVESQEWSSGSGK